LNELFKGYGKWKVLTHFLENPNTGYHIKQLARILKASPASVSKAAKYLEKKDMLQMEEKGLAHIYRLNPENPIVPPLKKAYGISLVLSAKPAEKILETDPNTISLALIGSYADGSYDEHSDIDLLIITSSEKQKHLKAVEELEKTLGKKVSPSILRLSEWRSMAKKEDAFYKRTVENHILLYGSGLK